MPDGIQISIEEMYRLLIKIDGTVPDCTEAEARALYTRFAWITAQARAFVEDRANFLKASPTA